MQHPVSENVVHASVLYLIIKALKKYLFITYHALLALHVPKMNTGFDFSKAQISEEVASTCCAARRSRSPHEAGDVSA